MLVAVREGVRTTEITSGQCVIYNSLNEPILVAIELSGTHILVDKIGSPTFASTLMQHGIGLSTARILPANSTDLVLE